jgi:hypothetical protein
MTFRDLEASFIHLRGRPKHPLTSIHGIFMRKQSGVAQTTGATPHQLESVKERAALSRSPEVHPS